MITPESAGALAAALAGATQPISLGGAFSKHRMGGPAPSEAVTISTRALNRVLIFEPKDLTISVEAGLPWAELTRLLDQHQMMIPLDPPLAEAATVGGVVASNSSGPRRRLYGTARDLVIGMTFATMEGKLIQSGGMVVKNVAGLDMSKLLIGSFGTLGAIASVNFKLIPKPPLSLTLALRFATAADAIAKRDSILKGVLQPAALDLLSPAASSRVGLDGWTLLLNVGGSEAVLRRYQRELPEASTVDDAIWTRVQALAPEWPGPVLRVSTTLDAMLPVLEDWDGPILARAANGVLYLFAADSVSVPAHLRGVVEWGGGADAWPRPGAELAVMMKVKTMLDPKGLLNPGRLYGRI